MYEKEAPTKPLTKDNQEKEQEENQQSNLNNNLNIQEEPLTETILRYKRAYTHMIYDDVS